MNPSSRRRLAAVIVLGASLGCAHIPEQSEFAKKAGVEASTAELSTQSVELGRGMMREIEIAADSIDRRTTNPRIKRNTLLWRLTSVPAVTEAALRSDPITSLLDLYAFRLQMSNFLESPAGDSTFGPDVVIGQRAMTRVESQWVATAQSMGAKLREENRDKLNAWALANPIDRVPFTRPSVVGTLAHTLTEEQGGIGAAVGGIQGSIDRIESRISLANENVVKQTTWLAELAAIEARHSPEAVELTSTLSSTRELIDEAPEMVAAERTALMAEVDRQRLATLVAVAEERAIMVAVVANERALALAAVDEQRRLAMRDVDSLRVRVVADGFRLVDHLVWRLAELFGALIIVATLGLLMMRRGVRRVA